MGCYFKKRKTKWLNAFFREDHQAMLLAVAESLVPRGHGREQISITETTVQWAATMLLSRSFSLTLQEQKKRAGSFVEETVALVPWADMLNHSSVAGRESCLVYDQRSGMVTLQAHCAYSEGQQVFDSYGPTVHLRGYFLIMGSLTTRMQTMLSICRPPW